MEIIDNQNDFVAVAEHLIKKNELEEARQLLNKSIKKMPSDWKPYIESTKYINIFCWNKEEFKNYVEFNREKFNKVIYWHFPSYSKAFYLLAYVLTEQNYYDKAMIEINNGLQLEPDHPKLISEKAYIYSKIGDDKTSLFLLQKALNSRLWISSLQKNHILREQAVALTNLNRLDEAKTILEELVNQNPEDSRTIKDLRFVEKLQINKKQNEEFNAESDTYNQLNQNIAQIFQNSGEEGVREWLEKFKK